LNDSHLQPISDRVPLMQKSRLSWLRIDPVLSGLLVLLMVFSLVTLWSAGSENFNLIIRQGLRFGLAFLLMVALTRISLSQWLRITLLIYSIGLCLLILVMLTGAISKGAQRWLDLGVIRFQPSELMKLGVPMMVALFLRDKQSPLNFINLIVASLIALIPMLLIAKQPDLGTAVVVGASGALVILLKGIPKKIILLGTVLFASLLPVFWHILHDYQRQRILMMLDPERDPLGRGYHIIQSKIAVGSGGVFGKGWQMGTQSNLDFLPERTTDFIFAVYSEEFGFVGAVILILIYLCIIARGLFLTTQLKDEFSRLLCGSLILSFFVYLFVNMGMVVGILPVVGLPLPFMSYGGTSLVTLMAGFGILMSLSYHTSYLRNP